MSVSRFTSQDLGNLILSGHSLTATNGNLLVNGQCINSSNLECATIGNLKLTGNLNGQNLQLTSDSILLNGSVIGTTNTAGSVNSVIQTAENDYFGTPIPYFTNTLGNVITNTAWNYYPGNSPFGLGYTSGGLLATDDAGTIFYLGDDNVFLGNINNSTSCSIELVSNNTTQIVLNATGGTTITGNLTVNGDINMPGENAINLNTINAQTINTDALNITNFGTSHIIVTPTNRPSTSQDTILNSAFGIYGPGSGGTVVNVDFSTFYQPGWLSSSRISLIDDGNYASSFDIMTKQSNGVPDSPLVSRLFIEPVNGYIGINNNEPGYQLDVNGTMRVNGDTTMGNVNTSTINVNNATVTNLLITGSITTPIINIGQQSTNGNYIVTKEMSGTTFFINKNPADNGYIYLPTPSPGLNFKFIQANPEQNWTPICVPGQYIMIGQINVTGTQGSSYANTTSPIFDVDFSPSAQIGDTINIISDGTYYYYSGNSFNIDGIQKNWD